jgi:hypothetical protein
MQRDVETQREDIIYEPRREASKESTLQNYEQIFLLFAPVSCSLYYFICRLANSYTYSTKNSSPSGIVKFDNMVTILSC